jgi:hypothetical protein
MTRTRRGAALVPPAFWIELQASVPPTFSLVADRDHAKRDALGLGAERAPRQRPPRSRTTRPRLAAHPLRGHAGRLIIPWQPGPGISKHLLAMLLHCYQVVQRIHPGLHTGGNDAGKDAGDVGTMFGGIEQGVLALANTQFERPLGHIIVERCAGLFRVFPVSQVDCRLFPLF